MCTSFCLQEIGIAMLRSKVRGAYKIEVRKFFFSTIQIENLFIVFKKGSVCADWLTTHFCPCCSALQIYRELKYHGEAR